MRTAVASHIFARLFSSRPETKQSHSYNYAATAYMHAPGKPVWSARNYTKFADEAYIRNVIAHRCVTLLADAAASVPLKLTARNSADDSMIIKSHPLLKLMASPNPLMGGAAFFEALYSTKLISGNAYIQAVGPAGEAPAELHLLRPDRVQVIAGKGGVPQGYRYTVGEHHKDFPVDRITGRSRILHLKCFHPTDDWYGLSPIESAAYSIDQHNQAGAWNQALLQNGARPTGALIVKGGENNQGSLSEEQFHRLKGEIDTQFSGAANAGRPLLLEGGLEWKDMSLSPRDMDFIEAKNASARDIALAFGVPPQMLGIPGDNTYANLAEARLALWEQTILPMVNHTLHALNSWLVPMFPSNTHYASAAVGSTSLVGGEADVRPIARNSSAAQGQKKSLNHSVTSPLTDDGMVGATSALPVPPTDVAPFSLSLTPDTDAISALSLRREALWDRVKDADFLSNEEKREMLGIGIES